MPTVIEISIGMILAGLTALIHYETLRLTSASLPRLTIPPRTRILVVIFVAFFAHLLEIGLYAVCYLILGEFTQTGGIEGLPMSGFYDYLYYSMVMYTTLGIGDLYPLGGLRLITGMESLVGLMMITWSASFTYLAMEKFWGLHGNRRRKS